MKTVYFFILLLNIFLQSGAQVTRLNTTVLVVGGTTGGTAAGIQSARSGAATLIVEQTSWLGGMLTAAGVSCTDGNHELPGGIWEEFRQALYKHYNTRNLLTGWVSATCFEPHVGDSIFKAFAARERNLQVRYGWYFDKTLKQGNHVIGAVFTNLKGKRLEVLAAVTVDATELGDVYANGGAAFDLGTEDSSQSGEKIAPGKSPVIQDLTWAATLKDYGPGADRTIPKPASYDALKYFCSTSEAPCNGKPYAANTRKVLEYGRLPAAKGFGKFMLNWPAHGNDDYLDVVDMKPIDRERSYRQSKEKTLGFIYFLQTELKQKQIGLADDEMDHGMAFIPYNREGRRLRGIVRFNIDHIRSPYQYTLYRTGIAVGDYPVDHHHGQYPGKIPAIPFPQVPSFNLPLGALIPAGLQGLIVCEKGISVSNIANGTTRLQPIVLLTGQAAGVLAALSARYKGIATGINVREVQDSLLYRKCYLMPFVDVLPDDPAWASAQRIGLTGIMKGVGKSQGWANKTFFYPDSLMKVAEISDGIQALGLPFNGQIITGKYATLADLFRLYSAVKKHGVNNGAEWKALIDPIVQKYRMTQKNTGDALTRREVAVYLDCLFPEYYQKHVSLKDGSVTD